MSNETLEWIRLFYPGRKPHQTHIVRQSHRRATKSPISAMAEIYSF